MGDFLSYVKLLKYHLFCIYYLYLLHDYLQPNEDS